LGFTYNGERGNVLGMGTTHIRLDRQVLSILRQRAEWPNESVNTTVRKMLGLPPLPKGRPPRKKKARAV